jgi:hypothetical protein
VTTLVSFLLLIIANNAAAQPPPKTEPPYSCRLLYDEQRKCAFGSCDKRTVERLRLECLRDGGRP